jgi:transposase
MTAVMIGVDPHKGSHTAVAIGSGEEPLGQLRVRASDSQAQRLVAWAARWPERTWAVEGAGGLERRSSSGFGGGPGSWSLRVVLPGRG